MESEARLGLSPEIADHTILGNGGTGNMGTHTIWEEGGLGKLNMHP